MSIDIFSPVAQPEYTSLSAIEKLRGWLHYLEQLHPSEIELGLDRCRTVYKRMLSDYQSDYISSADSKVVLVGGTNGKGTTIATIERFMLQKGLQVGAYTSPHISVYNERVRINGKDVDDISLVSSFENVEKSRQGISLTYFEFGTLCCLDIFARQKLDVVLLEIGLGGRLDAVNIVEPDVSIITSVSLDHTDWLGDSVEKIAYEKAGILRSDKPAILGVHPVPTSIQRYADEIGANIEVIGKDFSYRLPSSTIPESNIQCALRAIELLEGEPIAQERIVNTLPSVHVPGRLEAFEINGVPGWMDVGHNPEAAAYLATKIAELSEGKSVVALYSGLVDKDIQQVLMAMSCSVDHWFIAPLQTPRAASLEQLKESSGFINKNLHFGDSIAEAFNQAVDCAKSSNGCLLVFGSFFTIEAVRQSCLRNI